MSRSQAEVFADALISDMMETPQLILKDGIIAAEFERFVNSITKPQAIQVMRIVATLRLELAKEFKEAGVADSITITALKGS